MSTPMPPDHEIEAALQRALHAEAERVTPDPALHRILERAHEAERPRLGRRRWWPMLAGAAAAGAMAAAAIVVFAPSDEPTRTEPATSCAEEIREGCRVELAVYFARSGLDMVVSRSVPVESSGNVGLDAVQALLDERSRDPFVNPWHGYNTVRRDTGPIAEVNDVTHADGVITVDFDRPLMTDMASLTQSDPGIGRVILQQLVLTVQSALRTDDPVLITVNGEEAPEAFEVPLPGPIPADPSVVEGIRVEQPTQGASVTSPVTISGTSSTNEGTIRWSINRDGETVDEGFDTAGGPWEYQPFRIRVRLEPGDYTVKLWAPNQASGGEAWAGDLSVVYRDFTVE